MESINATLSDVDWEAFGASMWAFANEPIVCALVPATIAAILAQRVNLVVQQNVASMDAIKATASAQDQLDASVDTDGPSNELPPLVESVPSSPSRSSLSEEDNRRLDAAAALIKSIKDYVEKTAAGVRDGRRRRKYSNVSRHDYRVLVLALAEDGAISSADANRLNYAFSLWRPFQRRRTPAPDFVINELRSVAKEFAIGG